MKNFLRFFVLCLLVVSGLRVLTNQSFSGEIDSDREKILKDDILIVDLNNDGLDIPEHKLKEGAFFDWNNSKFSNHSDWIGPGEAFIIFYDKKEKIKRIYLSEKNFLTIPKLLEKDVNKNGLIDKNDLVWTNIYLWQDKNTDAYIQDGEFRSLDDLSVKQIEIPLFNIRFENEETSKILYHRPTYDKQNTRYSGDVNFKFETLFLPNLRGFGKVANLNVKASQDDNLKKQLADFCNQNPADMILKKHKKPLEEIMFYWAGVQDVDTSVRGEYIDARKLFFMEQYFSMNYYDQVPSKPDPNLAAADYLNKMWDEFIIKQGYKIIGQCPFGKIYFEGLKYDLAQDKLLKTTDFVESVVAAKAFILYLDLESDVDSNLHRAYWKRLFKFLSPVYGESFSSKIKYWYQRHLEETSNPVPAQSAPRQP